METSYFQACTCCMTHATHMQLARTNVVVVAVPIVPRLSDHLTKFLLLLSTVLQDVGFFLDDIPAHKRLPGGRNPKKHARMKFIVRMLFVAAAMVLLVNLARHFIHLQQPESHGKVIFVCRFGTFLNACQGHEYNKLEVLFFSNPFNFCVYFHKCC